MQKAAVLVLALSAATAHAVGTNSLQNSSFGKDLSYWTPIVNAKFTIAYDTQGRGALPGSVGVTVNFATVINNVIAGQCVNVYPGASYTYGTWFRYPSSAATPASAVVGLSWYTQVDCKGSVVKIDETFGTPTNMPDTWLKTQETLVSPFNAHSVYVQIDMTTTEAKLSSGLFDDVFFDGGLPGDASGNGTIGVEDVFSLINYLFTGGPRPIGPCDVNEDDKVDVNDVFYLVNYLFAGGPLPPAP